MPSCYGVLVANVNVSVLPYVPARSGSVSTIDCLTVSGTGSIEVGPLQLLSRTAAAPTGLNGPPVTLISSGRGNAEVPLTMRPALLALRSDTDNVASPVVAVTRADVVAV